MNRHLSLLVAAGLFLSTSVAVAAPPKKARKAKPAKPAVVLVAPPPQEEAEEATPAAPAPAPSPVLAAPAATPSASKAKTKAKPMAEAPAAEEPAAKPAESTPADGAADASGDKPERRITIAAMAGVGFNETKIKTDGGDETKDGVSTQGAGIGLRGGYTLPMKVYLGAAFVYHVGGTNEVNQVKYTGSQLYLGAEVGYDYAIGPIVVRPYAGLGYGTAKAKAEAGGQTLVDRSEGGFALWPGLMARYNIDMFFVGADARYALVTGTDKITNAGGAGVFAMVGASF